MKKPEHLNFIKKINTTFTGTLDFSTLAKKATNSLVEDLGFQAGGIFRCDFEKEILKAYAFASRDNSKKVLDIFQKPFSKMTTPLNNYLNFLGETASTGKTIKSDKLEEFACPTVTKSTAKLLQKAVKVKQLISIPVFSEKAIIGTLLVGKSDSFTKDDLETLKVFSTQIGLAMGNVMAHERIVQKYKESLEREDKGLKKKTDIKFTLRINEDIENFLNYKALNTKKSKAEFVRQELEKMMAKDENFKKYFQN